MIAIKKPNILISRVHISSDSADFFANWQANLQELIASFPGFLSLEILAPNQQEKAWTIVQRFSNAESVQAWKQSDQRARLFNELSTTTSIEESFSEERTLRGVVEVIVTELAAEKRSSYQKWLSKIHQAEAKVPGFQGLYVQAPLQGQGRYWITFLQFDTADHLDHWLGSTERQEILKELDPLIKAFESHRIISPYAGWFSSIAKMGALPPVWKQTMLVLLVLFPIVMLEFRFLNPLTQNLDISLATFIGNAISVALISWPMMPIAIYFFRWWLTPRAWKRTKINIIGTILLIIIYFIEILIFWYFKT